MSKPVSKSFAIITILCSISLLVIHTFAAYLVQTQSSLRALIALVITFVPTITLISLHYIFTRQANKLLTTCTGILASALIITLLLNNLTVFYGFYTDTLFDFNFFFYNLYNVSDVLLAINPNIYWYMLSLIIWIVCSIKGFYVLAHQATIRIQIGTNLSVFITLLLSLSCIPIIQQFELTKALHRSLYEETAMLKTYQKYYLQSIEKNKQNNTIIPPTSPITNDLYLIQLESLNAQLVNPQITPTFMQLASNGIFVPQIQGTSILTSRSHETYLCSIFPALKIPTAFSPILMNNLHCLPKIMKQQGYKTFFFQSYPNLKFDNILEFMQTIGFDEAHSSDIMHLDDPQLPWGYPEDIFYDRVFQYLEKFAGQKKLVYIAVDTTNHYPFYSDTVKNYHAQRLDKIPFPQPQSHRDNISNATNPQDQMLEHLYQNHLSKVAADADIVIFGDHSYPIEIHESNSFQGDMAFQENLTTSLLFLPSTDLSKSLSTPQSINTLVSHLDLLPTILDAYQLNSYRFTGQSFLRMTNRSMNNCLLSLQPYDGTDISLIQYPYKSIHNIRENTTIKYNLHVDPDEKSPISNTETNETDLVQFTECLDSLLAY